MNRRPSSIGPATIQRFAAAAITGALFSVLSVSPVAATNGHFLHAVGPIDSAMGGSTLAEPQDTLSAMFNNVGGMTEIPGTRVDLSLEMMRSRRHIRSTLGGVTGQTQSNSDFGLIPAFGVAHTPQESAVTYFIGALGVSGFGVDYPQDDSNPVLRPQIQGGQNTGGFGKIYSFYQLLRITGGAAVKLSPDLSVGFSPAINYATLQLTPFPATTPDCTAEGVCTYPSVEQAPALGAGFLTGLRYRVSEHVSVGLGYTSPQWFTKFRWNSTVANPELASFGKGRTVRFRLDAPQSIGFGIGLKPSPELLFTLGAKWVNFANTKGLSDDGFDSQGRVKGLGWNNAWTAGIGTQYRPVPWLALRLGYNFSEDPVADRLSFFNVASQVVIEHHVTGGIGTSISERVDLNLSYYHAFAGTVDGPFVAPGFGNVPGSAVLSSLAIDSVLLGVTFKL